MLSRNQRIVGAGVGIVAVGAVVAVSATGASADDTPPPPDGARAVVQVSPNPTVERGQAVTITGHCGGGTGLKGVFSGGGGGPEALTNVKIVNDDPNGFEATATVSEKIGNGVGPVLVDCGGQAGVTLLVTHV